MGTIHNIAELCIYLLTWNVGTHSPNNISFNELLSLEGKTRCILNKLPDMYVLGFQEAFSLNPFKNIFQKDKWTVTIGDHLSKYNYVMLETTTMQGMLLNVWTKPEHLEHIKDKYVQFTKRGLGGIWGNKGAISVRMSLYGTGVSFILAHLSPHDDINDHIYDYNYISKRHTYLVTNYCTLDQHDLVFWIGDLNYRLNGNHTAWDIQKKIAYNQLKDLSHLDQLSMVRKKEQAFALMKEQTPSFPPTCKFIEGTSNYNLKRKPAWCDRILYRVAKNKYQNIELRLMQTAYKSHPQYTLSDHKPVTAQFLYTIKANTSSIEGVYNMTHLKRGKRCKLIILA